MVDPAAPEGFGVGPDSVNGSLSLAEAAESAPVPKTDLQEFLRDHGYAAGYARVWTAGESFVTGVAYELKSSRDGAAMVDLVRASFGDVHGGQVEVFPSIPGAVEYRFYRRSAPTDPYQLCHGFVFAVAQYVSLVSGCGNTPPDGKLLEARARNQHTRALQLAHRSASG